MGFNKVFGYYIEVTKANTASVPEHYIRKQTLVNSERYITPELKEYESMVLNAEERIEELERRLFTEVCQRIAAPGAAADSRSVGACRCGGGAGRDRRASSLRAPSFEETPVLRVVGGRHPVVELAQDEPFVPNDLVMDAESRIHIVTGPNMAGKSVFLRQAADRADGSDRQLRAGR